MWVTTPNSIKTAYETGRCGQNGVDLCYPLDTYDERPQAADRWRQLGLRSPAYYGRPIQTTADIGQEIAADPRFSRCMARRVYGYVAQIEPEDVPQMSRTTSRCLLNPTKTLRRSIKLPFSILGIWPRGR